MKLQVPIGTTYIQTSHKAYTIIDGCIEVTENSPDMAFLLSHGFEESCAPRVTSTKETPFDTESQPKHIAKGGFTPT